MTSKISPVARDEWLRTIDTFCSMNKGRMIKVERYGGGKPHEHMEEGIPLFSLIYNPPDEGNSLIIAVGRDKAEHEYLVEAPQELWVQGAAQEKGEAMEIVDGEGRYVSISLQ